jgi:prolyl-tRNA synthetase
MLGKTKKDVSKDETSNNAQLLIKGGFVQKEMAGVYAYLPLGYRVLQKIIRVIREEMDEIGGQEVHLGSLQNPEVWEKTERWSNDVIDVWFKTTLQSGTEVGLANTHEEPLTQIMTHYVQSYKDLPMYIYQFQTKFRNELRAKSGLLRTREFIMKDLYSFNRTQEGHDKFYGVAKEAYHKIFDTLGIGDKTFLTFASGKPFSKYSHEFQTICEQGEDIIYLDRNKKIAINKEVYTDEVINDLGLNKGDLEEISATEVGNIFQLGTKYSDALGLTYTTKNGGEKPVIMGSYGIGPGRAMATIVELLHDENGIIWPESIAPFKVHLVGLNLEDVEVKKNADYLYEKLEENDIEVLYDDRVDTTAGEKFADSDLIGIPYRAVVSKKTGTSAEVKKRTEEKAKNMSGEKLVSHLREVVVDTST